jgi:hypothetical protein
MQVALFGFFCFEKKLKVGDFALIGRKFILSTKPAFIKLILNKNQPKLLKSYC